jgi:hypothetical protein
MNQLPGGRECPLDLHYGEPRQPYLDVGLIIGRGRRIRRRRALAWAGSVLVAGAAMVSVITGVRGYAISFAPPASPVAGGGAAVPIDALVAGNPPVNGQLTLVSTWPRHWTTVAWATRDGRVCWAAFRTPMSGATEEVDCPWAPSQVPGEGAQALSPPLGVIFPAAPAGSALVPAVGLVTPRADRVTLTFSGREFTADVVPIPLGGGKVTGLFLAWVKLPPNVSGYGTSDFTREIAYDQAGHILARYGS